MRRVSIGGRVALEVEKRRISVVKFINLALAITTYHLYNKSIMTYVVGIGKRDELWQNTYTRLS